MGEIIQIHIGQAGAQIGESLWELYTKEHGIGQDWKVVNELKGNPNTLFHEIREGVYKPRMLFVDLDDQSLNYIRVGKHRKLFVAEHFIAGKEDPSNVASRAYYTLGRSIIDITLHRVRLLADKCHKLQGFIISHAIGGGTGSGMASLLLERLSIDYGKRLKLGITLYPSYNYSTTVVEPYNAVLATHSILEHLDASFQVDNEQLYKTCSKLDVEDANYQNINRIIAQVGSSISTANRFHGILNANLQDLCTNLIPYPRIHFIIPTYAPMISKDQMPYQQQSTVNDLVNYCFQQDNQLLYSDKSNRYLIASTLLFKGDVIPTDVFNSITNLKHTNNKQWTFVDWVPTGFKVGICNQQPTVVDDGDLASVSRSVSLFSNGNSIVAPISKLSHKFDLLYAKRSFIHWFVGEGMESSEFGEAREDIAALEMDFQCGGIEEDENEGEG